MTVPLKIEEGESYYFEPFVLANGLLLEEGVTSGRITVLNPGEEAVLLPENTLLGKLSVSSTFAVIDVDQGGVAVSPALQDQGVQKFMHEGYEGWTDEAVKVEEVDLSNLEGRQLEEMNEFMGNLLTRLGRVLV